ncbi:MAG: AAA family ATPase [Candidatus Woesearchaeota archaeon]
MVDSDKKDISDIMYEYQSSQDKLMEENVALRQTVNQLMEEVERMKKPPLMVCEVRTVLPDKKAIIKIPNGNSFLVEVITDEPLASGDTIYVDQKFLTVLEKGDTQKKFEVESFVILEKPEVRWDMIGGLTEEKERIREVVELPLLKPELFEKVGIQPPKGILLHGPPGTGKTMLAKAVAAETNSTFIEIVGSELVQKFIGEGAKLVKDIFDLAREKAPAIVFIDEIDSLAAKRIEMGTSGEREVQRTFMQLLAEIDGFNNLGDVKIIAATNRADILDPAITRPGRLERSIEIGTPDADGIAEILGIHTKRMPLEKVNAARIAGLMEGFSGAQIKAVCTEAGYHAIRDGRSKVFESDFESAIERVRDIDDDSYPAMFG